MDELGFIPNRYNQGNGWLHPAAFKSVQCNKNGTEHMPRILGCLQIFQVANWAYATQLRIFTDFSSCKFNWVAYTRDTYFFSTKWSAITDLSYHQLNANFEIMRQNKNGTTKLDIHSFHPNNKRAAITEQRQRIILKCCYGIFYFFNRLII